MRVPQVMIDAAEAAYSDNRGVRLNSVGHEHRRKLGEAIAAALLAAPTEPAGWLATVDESGPLLATGRPPADLFPHAAPLWVHPPVPDGETARLREALSEVAREPYHVVTDAGEPTSMAGGCGSLEDARRIALDALGGGLRPRFTAEQLGER